MLLKAVSLIVVVTILNNVLIADSTWAHWGSESTVIVRSLLAVKVLWTIGHLSGIVLATLASNVVGDCTASSIKVTNVLTADSTAAHSLDSLVIEGSLLVSNREIQLH